MQLHPIGSRGSHLCDHLACLHHVANLYSQTLVVTICAQQLPLMANDHQIAETNQSVTGIHYAATSGCFDWGAHLTTNLNRPTKPCLFRIRFKNRSVHGPLPASKLRHWGRFRSGLRLGFRGNLWLLCNCWLLDWLRLSLDRWWDRGFWLRFWFQVQVEPRPLVKAIAQG